MSEIKVGEKRQFFKNTEEPEPTRIVWVEITNDNIEQMKQYERQDGNEWVFGDEYTGEPPYNEATIVFNDVNGRLEPDVQEMYNGGRHYKKVKTTKSSKKAPTSRRRRSSKRKARKARTTRRKY